MKFFVNINVVVAIALLSLASSCGIYSKYQRPVEESELTDELYKYIDVNANSDTTSFASLPWRELFTDSDLQTIIEKGLQSNTDLNVARLNVDKAQASLSAARKALLPSLNLAPQGSMTAFNGTANKTYNVALTSSWEIDLFGKLRNAKMQSRSALEQSVAYQQAVRTGLIATIAGSYYSLLMLDEQLKISEQTLHNWDENLRAMRALMQAGRINETSVLQSEASRVALSSSIVTIKEQIAELESVISLLLAMPTKNIKRGSIEDVEFSQDISVGVPLQLLSNRPDVRMAESALAEAFYATAAARASLYPSLSLSGSAGYTNSFGVIMNPADMLYNLVASIVQPIFNRGALKAQVKISKAQQEQALLQFNQAILDAGAEVNNALIGWQSASERLQYGATQVDLLNRTVAKTELLMKHGACTSLEVLTAQQSLLQAQLSYSLEKYNQSQGVINLYRALGGGEE